MFFILNRRSKITTMFICNFLFSFLYLLVFYHCVLQVSAAPIVIPTDITNLVSFQDTILEPSPFSLNDQLFTVSQLAGSIAANKIFQIKNISTSSSVSSG